MTYDEVHLTESEIKEAILEAKKRKFFKEKHSAHWIESESRIKKVPVKQLMK